MEKKKKTSTLFILLLWAECYLASQDHIRAKFFSLFKELILQANLPLSPFSCQYPTPPPFIYMWVIITNHQAGSKEAKCAPLFVSAKWYPQLTENWHQMLKEKNYPKNNSDWNTKIFVKCYGPIHSTDFQSKTKAINQWILNNICKKGCLLTALLFEWCLLSMLYGL